MPISLTNLVIYFSLFILGTKKGTISYLIYLLIGLVGIPVFSSFTSGPGKLFGPTGDYLDRIYPVGTDPASLSIIFVTKKLSASLA
ncbi:MAG: biotin transporter BioY [Eubacterium ramulus]